jgi:hypothetical protein
MVEENRLKFEYRSGDFVGFLTRESSLEKYLQKYEFVQISNISNVTEQLVDQDSLIYLKKNTDTHIVAHIVEEVSISL